MRAQARVDVASCGAALRANDGRSALPRDTRKRARPGGRARFRSARGRPRRAAGARAAQPASSSRASRAVSDGVLPTFTPAVSSASFFAWAVPDEPETIAPAWPIVLPSGAVKPAT